MPDTSPLIKGIDVVVQAQGTAGTAQDQGIGEAPFDGTVVSAYIIPEAAVAAHGTNFRNFRVVNKGQAGSGSTVVASYATSSVSLVAFDEMPLALSGTPANLVVAQGDVLAADETTGGAGVAHAGYKIVVQISRS